MNPRKVKILIVEDEPLVAKDIQYKLERQGYQISAIVNTGIDAIHHAIRNEPDLILMDIVLPNTMDGIQAASEIRQIKRIPIIYLTAYSDQAFLERAKITDPMAYILKPASERDLNAAITIALSKQKTEQQQIEINLRNATLSSFGDALLVWNKEGKIIQVNDALLSLLNTKETALLGNDITEMLTFIDTEKGTATTDKIIYLIESEGQLKDDRELILKLNNNLRIPVRVSGNQIIDAHNTRYGYVMQIRDDTERKNQVQALRESEAHFRQLSEHIETIFCLSDLEKKQIIYLSPAYEKIYGRPADASLLQTSPLPNHVHPEDTDKVNALIHAIHTHKKCQETFRITRLDGAIRWVHTRCYPVKNADNQIYRMACLIDDVTGHKKTDLKLQQAATVFDNTAEGIMITDTNLDIITVNKAFTTITGYSEDEAIGNTPRLIKSGEHDSQFYKKIWHTLANNGHWQGEITNRRKNGTTFPEWITISAIYGDNGKVINYIAILSDISSLKKSQEKLDYLAHHDHLTGFANRLLINDRLEHAIKLAERENKKVTVLLMDLDRFKDINDSLGHAAGDELLKLIAERLKSCLRDEDTLGRLGGDEFIFILEKLDCQSKIQLLAEKIQHIFYQPFLLENREIDITASMGISIYPDNGFDTQTLIKHADLAMYKAKKKGRNNFFFYSEDLNTENSHRLTLSSQMQQGLKDNQFVIYYQPQLSLTTGQITGMEALLRWNHPEKGLIQPCDFIPLAEETGLIVELGNWVLNQACEQCQSWNQQYSLSLVVSVNLSARQLLYNDIVSKVKTILKRTGLEAKFLELEITENSLMEKAETITHTLDALKSDGVALSIDNFGTGYSSLSYLKRFPIDKLKIDRSFVAELSDVEQDAAVSRSIIALGKSLNLAIVAEGVETKAQKEFMLAEGCEEMLGYLFSQPLPVKDFEKLLKTNSKIQLKIN